MWGLIENMDKTPGMQEKHHTQLLLSPRRLSPDRSGGDKSGCSLSVLEFTVLDQTFSSLSLREK